MPNDSCLECGFRLVAAWRRDTGTVVDGEGVQVHGLVRHAQHRKTRKVRGGGQQRKGSRDRCGGGRGHCRGRSRRRRFRRRRSCRAAGAGGGNHTFRAYCHNEIIVSALVYAQTSPFALFFGPRPRVVNWSICLRYLRCAAWEQNSSETSNCILWRTVVAAIGTKCTSWPGELVIPSAGGRRLEGHLGGLSFPDVCQQHRRLLCVLCRSQTTGKGRRGMRRCSHIKRPSFLHSGQRGKNSP
jgi:hypothetical protein